MGIKPKLRAFKFLLASVLIIILFAFFYLKKSSNIEYYEYKNTVYSVVIDAGSTGSRIHVFKLNHPDKNEKRFDIKLINEELLIKVNPGLSSFSKNPENAGQSIEPLLRKATEVIPQNYHKLTRLSLKATAGLRLVSDEIANRILENVKNLFKQFPFKSKHEDVSILDGKFEGIYSWVTLNYALNYFDRSREFSVCALDMGGGSTQVTFVPEKTVSPTYDSQDLVNFNIDEINYNIFSKSFLGFGLMSARMNIFKYDTLGYLKENSNKTENELFSVCILPNIRLKWVYQEMEFFVNGPDNKEQHSYEKCYKNVIKTIKIKLNVPSELKKKEIYAFSFYFDRLSKANAFKSIHGGKVRIDEILERAKSVCNNLNSNENKSIDSTHKDYPFLCMDLTFIYAILSQGYGLPDEKEINVYNEVNKMEISWALGAAFHMLSDQNR